MVSIICQLLANTQQQGTALPDWISSLQLTDCSLLLCLAGGQLLQQVQ